jgi:NADH:ubiquinone oxidoreductase subunit E/NAD-dependent dihydropyrimidine dehydrogenase PreA subunit
MTESGEMPDQPSITENNTEPKIGVYICECGINISATVDVEQVTENAKSLPDVEVSRFYKYMCSDPGQSLIKNDIKELGLTQVIVASCSPRMHEPTFRAVVEEAGLNPYCFEMANIREHCSWAHMHEKVRATQKADDLVKMAVAKARLLQPLERKEVPVTPTALVIGGGIAGIQAALETADSGFKTYLVEQSPSIGGRMSQLDKTFPTLDCSACILTPKMVDVARHPNIELFTYSEVDNIEGYVGNFTVTVKKKARSIDESKCTGCAVCTEHCPILLQPQIIERSEVSPDVRDQIYIDELIVKHSEYEAPLVQIMLEVNEHYRYLPRDILEYLSYKLEIPLSMVYRVATFYKAFSLEIRGKYHLKVCLGTACHVRGARSLADKVRTAITAKEEGLFSLETVNCLGACALGPILVVNDEVHGNVSIDQVEGIISTLEGE